METITNFQRYYLNVSIPTYFRVMIHEISDDISQLLSHALMRMSVTIDYTCRG